MGHTERIAQRSVEPSSVFGQALAGDAVIRTHLALLTEHLRCEGCTELWINEPGALWIERQGRAVRVEEPRLSLSMLRELCQAAGVYAKQQVNEQNPILSATLPDGERLQCVLPPAVEPGKVSITIRVPSAGVVSIDEYEALGSFQGYAWLERSKAGARDNDPAIGISAEDQGLAQHLLDDDLRGFLLACVKGRKTIAVVGDTGSGKTTLMKALCQHIPSRERLVTIEDVRELHLPLHDNKVHLLYSKSRTSSADLGPSDLIASCMRMTPSRVLLAELRGAEAWDFLKLLTTGHSGSITSFHAESCALAYERFMFMAKEHIDAAALARHELTALVSMTVDVMVHITRAPKLDEHGQVVGVRRFVDEVSFNPWLKVGNRA